MISLAIETSCDETSAAVLENGRVLSNVISTQLLHSKYGGIVPEMASREHIRKIVAVTGKAIEDSGRALNEISIVCATTEPGLIGALLVGANFAKGLSVALNVPFIPVNHIQAHLYSPYIGHDEIRFPFLGLIVSGGHTLLILAEDYFRHKVLGRTVDDAAGEAFDKAAKILGLGYPGGREIDKRAAKGNISYHRFPKSQLKNSKYDFSFSGVKTSLLYFLRDNFNVASPDETTLNNICASFQDAVTGMLFDRTKSAVNDFGITTIAVSGGVSANSNLRSKLLSMSDNGVQVIFPEIEYTTDNAAMIGYAGYLKLKSEPQLFVEKTKLLKTHSKPRLDYDKF